MKNVSRQPLKFKSFKMGKKGDLNDFACGVIVGVRG